MTDTTHPSVPLSALGPLGRHCSPTAVVDVSPGWVGIVRSLNAELSELDPKYQLSRLEAHDGTLVMVWHPSDEPGWPQRPTTDDPAAHEAYAAAVRQYLGSVMHHRRAQWEDRVREFGAALVHRAWVESSHTCEDCGTRTERREGTRLVCKSCATPRRL